jgi:hypothetical protein
MSSTPLCDNALIGPMSYYPPGPESQNPPNSPDIPKSIPQSHPLSRKSIHCVTTVTKSRHLQQRASVFRNLPNSFPHRPRGGRSKRTTPITAPQRQVLGLSRCVFASGGGGGGGGGGHGSRGYGEGDYAAGDGGEDGGCAVAVVVAWMSA